MKVIHLIRSLGYGGAESLVCNLAISLANRGNEIIVISLVDFTPLSGNLKFKNITTLTLGHEGTIYSLSGFIRSALKLRKIFKNERPDIIHSHLWLPDILSRLTAPRTCSLVTTLHSMDNWWYENSRFRSIGKKWLDSKSGKWRKVRYISISKSVKREACNRLGLQSIDIRVIINGINLGQYRENSAVGLKERVIIQVGRFTEEKGHLTSIKALSILKEIFPDVRLVLIGDGPLRIKLQERVSALGITEAVYFLGTRSDVPEQLRKANVFWMPSLREGLGIGCMEAMATGLPVVVSSVGGLPELVVEGNTGFLINPNSPKELADKTKKVFQNSSDAIDIGSSARRHAMASFSIETTTDNYLKAYQDILSGVW